MPCAGLRDLVDSIEKIQQLEHLQTLRANSQRLRLLSASLDWRLGRDGEYGVGGTARESGTGGEAARGLRGDWDDYNTAYAEFVERFTDKSGADDDTEGKKDPVDAIRLHDVPWPLTGLSVLSGSRITADGTLGGIAFLVVVLLLGAERVCFTLSSR